jgi:hypothetical protein
LPFYNLSKRFKSVTYDNNKKDAFIVERDDGSKMEFIPSKEGLYHYDFKLSIERCKEQRKPAEKTMVIQKVEGIKRNFSRREIDQANEAQRLYVILGRLSQKAFKYIIKRGKLINNQVTVQDFKNALQIYGVELGVLKGKTTRSKADPIKVQFFDVPEPKNIVLSVDLMYFTGLIFLTMVSRNIRFFTATLLIDRKKKTIMDALKQVLKIYQGKGHKIQNVEFSEEDEKGDPIHSLIANNKFQSLKDNIEGMGIKVNIVSKNEHAPEVERQNRVIKERARGIIQTLPYKMLPKKMRIAMIQYVVFWLNNIPKEDQNESPREMIIGHQVLDTKMVCKIPFGAYAQVHDNNDITNTMIQRMTGGINLGPSNLSGSYKFLSLETGDIIVHTKGNDNWTSSSRHQDGL